MSITYDLDCGDEIITLELLDDGTLIYHSLDFDIEDEIIAREMGFEPHPCFVAMDRALRWAAYRNLDNDIDIVEILLAAGADVHALDDEALRDAARYGHTDVVELLLECGADVHANNDEALLSAVKGCHEDVLRLLLEYGADVHARDDDALRLARKGCKGKTNKKTIISILEDWIKDHG